MTGEAFEREILCRLKARCLHAPALQPEDAVKFVFQAMPEVGHLLSGRLLITLDGPCASGKTTLAGKLARAFRGQVVHTDDFVIPHARKTPERLAVPGGNCDAERLVEEVVIPFKSGLPVRYRRYDCRRDMLLPEEELPDTKVLVLEGSYCNLPTLRKHADLRLFLDTPGEVREARLLARESAASVQRFRDLWIPLENAYFEAYRLPDEDCIVIHADPAETGVS